MPDIFSEDTPQKTVASAVAKINPVHLFTTFTKAPRGISFAEEDDDEDILLFLRRDFITNVPWIASTIGLIFVPFIIKFIFTSTGFSLFTLPHNIAFVLVTFYYLILVGFAFANFVSWFYNIGLVTTKRGVDIDFTELSTINVGTAALSDIIDVEYTQQGFFQSAFDFGDVRLRVEATGEVFVFEQVPRPTEVAGTISKLIGGKA